MKPALAVLVLLPVLTLAACGGDGSDVAVDPAPSASSTQPPAAPTAPGLVSTRGLVTVMDTGPSGEGPELCLGPVAESYPPQCSGPSITNWDWSEHRGIFEKVGDVRWGQFAVTGTWDGSAFTADGAIAAALYDALPTEPSPTPPPPLRQHTDEELVQIAQEVSTLPGAQGSYVADRQVFVDVAYDDGSLQEFVDAAYASNTVVVTSMLVDLDD